MPWKFFDKFGVRQRELFPIEQFADLPRSTSVPTTIVDGQEVLLVDFLTTPNWHWRLRYNAFSTATYKWEYIGGIPAIAFEGASFSTSSVTDVQDLVSSPPAFQINHPGIYRVEFGAKLQNGSTGSFGTITLYNGGVSTSVTLNGNGQGVMQGSVITNVIGSFGGVVEMRFKSNNASFSQTFSQRWIQLTPIAINQ